MTIDIFVLKGDLNGKIVVVRFFFCRVKLALKSLILYKIIIDIYAQNGLLFVLLDL